MARRVSPPVLARCTDSFMDAAALIGALHGRALRAVASSSGIHFRGLSQAARCKELPLDNRLRKKLHQIDVAFSFVRHVTQVKCDDLVQSLETALSVSYGAGDGPGTVAPNPTIPCRAVGVQAERRVYGKVPGKGVQATPDAANMGSQTWTSWKSTQVQATATLVHQSTQSTSTLATKRRSTQTGWSSLRSASCGVQTHVFRRSCRVQTDSPLVEHRPVWIEHSSTQTDWMSAGVPIGEAVPRTLLCTGPRAPSRGHLSRSPSRRIKAARYR